MKKSHNPFIGTFLLLFLAVFHANGQEQKSTPAQLAHQHLDAFMYALEQSAVSSFNTKQIQDYAQSEDKTIRSRAIFLMAQYTDRIEGKPLAALNDIAQYILSEEQKNKWRADLKEKNFAGAISWNREELQKMLDGDTELQFPHPSKWLLEYPELCVYASLLLSSLGQPSNALSGLNRVGVAGKDRSTVLAAEATADILAEVKRLREALEFYDSALQMIRHIMKGDYYEYNPDSVLAFARERILRKRKGIEGQMERDLYGAAFMAYKEARTLQLTKKDYLGAVASFKTLIAKFPQTVFSEAGILYGAQCLALLSEGVYIKEAENKTSKLKAELEEKKTELKNAVNKGLPEVRQKLANEIQDKTAYLTCLESISTGKQAIEDAINSLRSFISGNEYGLYREEAYIELAGMLMEYKLDPVSASHILKKAETWLEKVTELDQKLDELEVPDNVIGVSQPAKAGYEIDVFGNIDRMSIEPNHILNRHTCSWYLDDLRSRLFKMNGFLCFTRGEMEQAKKYYDVMAKYDCVNRAHEERGDCGDYKRLLWGLAHGHMYTLPVELKQYKGDLRFAVLLVDYYYVTMQFDRAAHLCRRILNGDAGRLNSKQKSYIHYVLGASLCWDLETRVEAVEEMKKSFALTKAGYTAERAMYGAANIATDYMGDNLTDEKRKKYHDDGIELFEKLMTTGKHQEFVYKAIIALAVENYEAGKPDDAINLLQKIPANVEYYGDAASAYAELIKQNKDFYVRKD